MFSINLIEENRNMKRICNLCIAIVAMFVMVSCAVKNSFDKLNGEWNVVSVGEVLVPESVDAFIGFDVAEQLVYGSTGCNHLTGALPTKMPSSTPLFSAIGSTRMLCANMSIENAMLPALESVVNFKVEGNNLYLLNADGDIVLTLMKR